MPLHGTYLAAYIQSSSPPTRLGAGSLSMFFAPPLVREYGLVVPFPAYGFAALVSNNENLNSPKQCGVRTRAKAFLYHFFLSWDHFLETILYLWNQLR